MKNAAGAVAWKWESDAFGNGAANQSPGGGPQFDAETGPCYNNARYYDPSIGRYISSDPIGLAGGINTYGYVGQAPTVAGDPTGLDTWIEGPSQVYGEPPLHQSISVGDPRGYYVSFSFGLTGASLRGAVYIDAGGGGAVERYKKTDSATDAETIRRLHSLVGTTAWYGVDDICRSWSQRQFDAIQAPEVKPPLSYATSSGLPDKAVSPYYFYLQGLFEPSSSSGVSTFR